MTKNICHIISGDLWAGAEAQAYSLIKGLCRTHNFTIKVITFNEGLLASRIADMGIQTDVVNESTNTITQMIRTTVAILKKQKIDIIHTHGFKENFVGGIAAKFSRPVTVIRTHHGKGMINRRPLIRHIEKLNARFLTHGLIAVSHDLKAFLVGSGFQKNKITVIHNGIDPDVKPRMDADAVRQNLKVDGNIPIVGTVGRLERVKGLNFFLESARRYLDQGNKAFFVIVGDGSLMGELRALAKNLHIEEYVRFTGFTENTLDFVNVFDVFVMSSIHEGVPMALLEALYLGKPVVATRVGGIPEVIEDHYDGLLIDPTNSDTLAKAIDEILKDNKLRDRLSSHAYRKVVSDYFLSSTVAETQELYERLS